MRRAIVITLGTILVAGLLSPGIFAEEDDETGKPILSETEIEISADTAVYSQYIWRGFKLDGDPVSQTGVYASGYGFDASVWGSFDIDSEDLLDSDEIDYSVGYTLGLEDYIKIPMSISGGYIYYDFPETNLNSQEVYVGASFDVLLSPAITWYHDFEDEEKGGGDGNYIVAEISHSFPVGGYPISLDLGAHAGYNNELFIMGDGGDVGVNAGLTFTLSKNCTLTPNAGYSIPFGDLEDDSDGNQDEEFYGGAVLAYSF